MMDKKTLAKLREAVNSPADIDTDEESLTQLLESLNDPSRTLLKKCALQMASWDQLADTIEALRELLETTP